MKNALGCFLYFSTLSIPLVVYKKCYFLGFRDIEDEIVLWESSNLIKSINIESFIPEDIDFNTFPDKNSDIIKQFISDYLFSTDGKSVERLQRILIGN